MMTMINGSSMPKSFPYAKLLCCLVLLAIIFIGYQIRLNYYFSFPQPGVSMDEYSNAWMGLSWIRSGYPVANSGLPAYKQHDYRYINVDEILFNTNIDRQVIDQPWFDHPPLLGLLVGGYAYLKGARVFEDTIIALIRKPMVWLSVVNIILVFSLTSQLYSKWSGLIAAAIYAFSPYSIISSRLVQAENGYIPFTLLALICMYWFLKQKRKTALILAGIFSGVAMLFKTSAIYIVPTLIILMLIIKEKNTWKDILIYLTLSFGIFMVYPVSGLAIDGKLFLDVMKANADRFYGIGPGGLKRLLFSSQVLSAWEVNDGWKYAGIIGLIFLANIKNIGKLEKAFVLVPFICYLFIYILFGSEPYGWYTYPIIPLIIVTIGIVISWIWKNKEWGLLAYFLLILPIGVNLDNLVKVEAFQAYAGWWRWGVIMLGIIIAYSSVTKISRLKFIIKPLMGVMLLASLYLGWLRIASLTPDSWFTLGG